MVDFVKHQLPGTFGGYNVHGMTLKQSEAYAMADGTSFDKRMLHIMEREVHKR